MESYEEIYERKYSTPYIGKKTVGFSGIDPPISDDEIHKIVREYINNIYIHETITEIHTISDADIAAKGFTLQNRIASGEESNVMLSINRLLMIYGIDFTASENYITWASMGLDEVGLFAGDIVVVRYIKA